MRTFHLFTLKDIPVYMSPGLVLLLAFYAWASGSIFAGLLFGACVVVSLLVHEFGHAMMAKRFRLNPRVLLHGFGGLCAHEQAERDRDDVLIIAAGPGAGLALGFGVYLMGTVASFLSPGWRQAMPLFATVEMYLLWINILWSLVNLIPLWPLDGGQLFRIGMLKIMSPVSAEKTVYTVGAVLAVLGAFWGMRSSSLLIGLICGFLAWENIQHLMDGRSGGAIRTDQKQYAARLKEAWTYLAKGDPREAARMGHLLREEKLHRGLLAEVWALLAVATTAQGEHEEALTYIQRAPDRPDVLAAAIRCHLALGNVAAAQAGLAMPHFSQLPQDTQETLRAQVDDASQANI
jgi:stage IV sporulation protein FB